MAARKPKTGGEAAATKPQTVVAPVDETSVRVRVKGTSTYASQYVRMRYDAAGDGPRSLGWSAPESSPRSLLTGQLDTLRRRSREQARNNPLCASILHALTSNVVGTGMRPLIADPGLQRLWRAWSGECDAHGSLDFGGLQALAFGEMVEAGECLARLRPRRPEDGLSVPLQLQLLEPEQLPSGVPAEAPLDRTINGVEFDVLERRLAYWLYRRHPGDALAGVGGPAINEVSRVDAREVLHVFRPGRAGQVRGVPWLAGALPALRLIDSYLDAELARKRNAALYGGFIRPPTPDANASAQLFGTEQNPAAAAHATADVAIEPMSPGDFVVLPPGWSVDFSEPADVGGSFEAFMATQLRAVAAAVGMPYELITGDVGYVNDRTLRGVLLEFRRRCRQWQRLLVHQFCAPAFRRFVETSAASGAWSPPEGTRLEDHIAPRWVGQAWEHIHPVQEAQADERNVANRLKSRTQVIEENGGDARELDAEIAEERRRARKLGIGGDAGDEGSAVDEDPAEPAPKQKARRR